eukprot:gene17559-27030_t
MDSESSSVKGFLSDGDSGSTRSLEEERNPLQVEAEEVEEEEDDESDETRSLEAAPADMPDAGAAPPAVAVRRSEPVTSVQGPSHSFVSETDDDGFMAMATLGDVEAFEQSSAAGEPHGLIKATDPKLLSDPETLSIERDALEGIGTNQLRPELRSIERTGMTQLRNHAESHVYANWLRKVLDVHRARHIKVCLASLYKGKPRAMYLFDRLRRRYWAAFKGAPEKKPIDALPLLSGTVTLEILLNADETSCVGKPQLPEQVATSMGRRAAGVLVDAVSVKFTSETLPAGCGNLKDKLVIIDAKAITLISTTTSGASYGALTGNVQFRVELVPLLLGGAVVGTVGSIVLPQYELNLPISRPVQKGTARVLLAQNAAVTVTFGAEVPERARGVGQVWVLQLQKGPDRVHRLEFSRSPYIEGAPGPAVDAPALTGEQVNDLNHNRRLAGAPARSKNWAAVNDKENGFRVLLPLPEAGFWYPEELSDLVGEHVIRGYTVTVDTQQHATDVEEARVYVALSEERASSLISQQATLQLQYEGKTFAVRLRTKFSKHHKKNAKELFLK